MDVTMREVTRMLLVEFIRQNKLTKILEMENKVVSFQLFEHLVCLHCDRSNNQWDTCRHYCSAEDINGSSKEV